MTGNYDVTVVGAGLAGCEAAYRLANRGFKVLLTEQKPKKFTPAHSYEGFAELVCSNSLKAERLSSAAGLLKREMEMLSSITVECAKKTSVSAGGALAVDRTAFSDMITQKIRSHENITVVECEQTDIPDGNVIIATGPLTSDALAQSIKAVVGDSYLSFFDAAAPIVTADSIDFEKAFYASRYDKGDGDYVNCPMNKEEYEAFYSQLVLAQSAPLNEFDKRDFKVYEGCMPIEVMAKRGEDTLRFGPLKPVGLKDPKTGKRPWAVVQLRMENRGATLFNLVGFQTNLKFPEQKRVFSMIPGLENAEFARYGVMHRNTFLDSPKLLNSDFSLKSDPRIYFAGQMTGVEGYCESAASGIIAAWALERAVTGKSKLSLPRDTMLGALSAHISNESTEDFQPMGANMGILPPLDERIKSKPERYETIANRALKSLFEYIEKLD